MKQLKKDLTSKDTQQSQQKQTFPVMIAFLLLAASLLVFAAALFHLNGLHQSQGLDAALESGWKVLINAIVITVVNALFLHLQLMRLRSKRLTEAEEKRSKRLDAFFENLPIYLPLYIIWLLI